MRQIAKKILTLVLACVMLAAMLPIPNASAATDLPDSIYLKQEGSRTCTLASTTMMLRSRMYLSGNSAWSSITEADVRKVAWSSQGLNWNFTYSINGNSMKVSHESVSGISVSRLKALLDAHPEGIVLYCKSKPHGVFLTDYEGDTFYCADPANETYSGRRLALEDSSLGAYYGSQASILKKVSAYWYISSYHITGDQCTVNYDPNGGSGSMDSRTVIFNDTLTLAANSFVFDGHTFAGWTVERSDHTWLVSGQGWLTEEEISAGGYAKHVYPDGWSGKFDSSWTGGGSGLSYTFYAQWEADHLPGDINGDGDVNNKDATRLFQYLAGWNVDVVESALDVNGDGEVNNKDATRLFQHLAGWNVEIF